MTTKWRICGIATAIALTLATSAFAGENGQPLSVQQLYALAGVGHWKAYSNNPVLQPGAKGECDAGAMGTMTVVKVGDVYHMYYEAWGCNRDHGATEYYNSLQIAHATSPDGVHWTKDPAPAIPRGADNDWDHFGTWDPYVLYENGQFKMWYGGGNAHCDWGYATSTDGTHFVKKGKISDLGQVEDDKVVHDKKTGHYFMYYWNRNFTPFGLYRAESPNETDFDFAHAVPIRIDGLPYPAADQHPLPQYPIYKYPQVFQNDGRWYIYFGKLAGLRIKGDSTGYATSSDGLHWTLKNPSVFVGHDANVLKVADNLWLMYYGPDGAYDQVGCDIRVALFKGSLDDLDATK